VRTIAVTGVSRGLGRALVREWAAAGHRIAGCARSADAVRALADEVGGPHRFTALDVRDDDAVAAWAANVVDVFGAPDLLVNNAALINANAPVWEVPRDEMDAVIDVNVKGVANVLRHLVPPMIARGSGVIVNVTSEWGRSTSPDVGPYCASKFAIEGLTKSLAQELPSGLAAIPLNPGIIDTEMLRSCFGDNAATYPTAEEWARTAAPFLLTLGREHNGRSLSVPA
jgi:NAD(P)-dependent dehydrogenase (short-subunit alcohol dehydrogenase family)